MSASGDPLEAAGLLSLALFQILAILPCGVGHLDKPTLLQSVSRQDSPLEVLGFFSLCLCCKRHPSG